MFSGIIENCGILNTISFDPSGNAEIEITGIEKWEGLKIGDSVAVDGACLTVTEFDDRSFRTKLSTETLKKTHFGNIPIGSRLNLERSLTLANRLDGHIVQGHVETSSHLLALEKKGEFSEFEFDIPEGFRPFFVEKGSVALNGVSLTVFSVSKVAFKVALIPITLSVTNLGDLKVGDGVHMETDIIARYTRSFYLYANEQKNSED